MDDAVTRPHPASTADEDLLLCDTRYRRYATLLVRTAVNVQPGQRLIVWRAPVDAAGFICLLTEEAYAAGASYVELFWKDDRLDLQHFTHTSPELLRDLPHWEIDVMEEAARSGSREARRQQVGDAGGGGDRP